MSRPDDYRGAPPGGSWRPTAAEPGGAPAGWGSDPGRPTAGPGWSAGVSGPGGGYPPADRSGSAGPVPAGSYRQVGGGTYPSSGPAGQSPTGTAPGGPGTGQHPAPSDATGGHRRPIDPAKLFGIIIAALGGLNFVFGFLPQVTSTRIDESLSVYAVGPGYVPILLLIAGLLALAAFLPGSERSRLAVAAVSVGGAVGALISLGTSSSLELLAAGQVSKGLGAVLLTIFGIIQAVVAIAAYVVGADLRAGSGDRSVAGSSSRGQAPPPAQQGWATDVPAPAWSSAAPAAPAPPPAVAPEPAGPVGYYAGYAPTPGSGAGPGGPGNPGPAPSGWGPPADDDRPTGPQAVVDPDGAQSPRPNPAERELPRVAPGWPDRPAEPVQSGGSAQPVGSTGHSDPDVRSRHAAADDRGRPAPTDVPDGPPEGATEVYRIPPRSGPDGPATP